MEEFFKDMFKNVQDGEYNYEWCNVYRQKYELLLETQNGFVSSVNALKEYIRQANSVTLSFNSEEEIEKSLQVEDNLIHIGKSLINDIDFRNDDYNNDIIVSLIIEISQQRTWSFSATMVSSILNELINSDKMDTFSKEQCDAFLKCMKVDIRSSLKALKAENIEPVRNKYFNSWKYCFEKSVTALSQEAFLRSILSIKELFE